MALVEAIGETHGRLKQRGVDYPEVDIRDEFLKVLDPLYRDGSLSRPPSREFCETLAVEYECRINPTWPMPGCVETLRALQDQRMPLGIVSNAQFFTPLLFPALLDESLENLGFHSDLCAWSYRCGEAKPSAKLFLLVLEALQSRDIEPEQVLYVGNDRINDIWPAAQAGMKTGLFAGDRRSFRPREGDPRCQGAKEDILLIELAQLPKVLSPS
jgi:putative hydrolase of the HAD superfamily